MTLQGLAIACAGATAAFLIWNVAAGASLPRRCRQHPSRPAYGGSDARSGVAPIPSPPPRSCCRSILRPTPGITLARCLFRREKLWRAHRDHFYQRAARGLGSHAAVVKRVALCNLVLIAAALWAVSSPLAALTLGVSAVGLLLVNLELAARRITSPEL